MRVGIFDHFGWAVAVTAAADDEVVDRRRIALVEPGVVEAPVHYSRGGLDDAALAALVAEVRASIARAASVELDTLAEDLSAPVEWICLRTWPPDFPQDVAVQRRPPYESRADAIMYRQVLADLAEDRGWPVHLYVAKDVLAQVPGDVLDAPRTALGPPWTKDHRTALAAALVAG